MRSVIDDLVCILLCVVDVTYPHFQGLPTDIVGRSSMFTGEEEIFAFARACSRLVQMGSKEWTETAGQK